MNFISMTQISHCPRTLRDPILQMTDAFRHGVLPDITPQMRANHTDCNARVTSISILSNAGGDSSTSKVPSVLFEFSLTAYDAQSSSATMSTTTPCLDIASKMSITNITPLRSGFPIIFKTRFIHHFQTCHLKKLNCCRQNFSVYK